MDTCKRYVYIFSYLYFQHHKHFGGSESIASTLIITGYVVKKKRMMRNVSQPFKFVMEDKIARFSISFSVSRIFGTWIHAQ